MANALDSPGRLCEDRRTSRNDLERLQRTTQYGWRRFAFGGVIGPLGNQICRGFLGDRPSPLPDSVTCRGAHSEHWMALNQAGFRIRTTLPPPTLSQIYPPPREHDQKRRQPGHRRQALHRKVSPTSALPLCPEPPRHVAVVCRSRYLPRRNRAWE